MPEMPFVWTAAAARRSAFGAQTAGEGAVRGSGTLIETSPMSEPVRQAIEHWHGIRPKAGVPSRRALDPVDIPNLLAHSELIDVLAGPLDFRYRLIGDVIDRISRDNYVGRRVREIPGQRPPSPIFELYAETVRRAAPVCAKFPYLGDDRFIDHVEVVTMPLTGEGARIERLWGVVVPAETELAGG